MRNQYITPKMKRCDKCNSALKTKEFRLYKANGEKRHSTTCRKCEERLGINGKNKTRTDIKRNA